MPALTPNTLTTPSAVRAELAGIRERGYAVAVEELQLGYVAVGAAVRDHEGRPVA
ncbi:MAG: IclR family transcriptional regulator, partial [Gemmatimonadetes bacterium]|nr:IclR family transcriptional regulator [Gemmatimonadota bacterium]NIQ58873.1 IclR family transcriptional regulator [Gemmatimonadota bacterium]NIU79049.1 IclR family transcriptional regulator [Gammaproteobacteria bacterium]NIX47778.1 IclR family transcriptional regulator [Gemmatimonadota bacterium]NIY12139.1 IclR family transcriptional regulator [Gemmatimonadota bacterium]